jgi:hypothetical protein
MGLRTFVDGGVQKLGGEVSVLAVDLPLSLTRSFSIKL